MRHNNAALLAQAQHGVVSAVDPIRNTVRVVLQPDGVETGDIAAPALAAGGLRIAIPLELGTQVLLHPIAGDAEQVVVGGVLFDAIVPPPVSPHTGTVAQPGEMLIVAGNPGAPGPDGSAPGAAAGGVWLHLMVAGLFAGVGGTTISIQDGSIALSVGGCTVVLTGAGLSVSGGDVRADGISLKTHRHGGVQGGLSETAGPQ